MISRVSVVPIQTDKSRDYCAFSSCILEHNLSRKELESVAGILTNPILERWYIDTVPSDKIYNFGIEVGFKPGVTDNIANTVKETIKDYLGKKVSTIEAYSSKIYFTKLNNSKEVASFASSLYNPLIETASILKRSGDKFNFLKKVPKVKLTKNTPVIKVSLNVSEEELVKLGREGIKDKDGSRRGPLALDLLSMKAIQGHFKALKRDPSDIELESLAQTWSEHCKHTIFANPIDDIERGLYKTYIKGATELIRKQKGEQDFCVSVFSDNAGGIVFDENYLITHKVETHNSPSALDPFGGAITGIVGVNRDTIGFGLGAKPVANTYGFCFSRPNDNRKLFKDKNLTQEMLPAQRIIEGVIKGINTGGNCSGIPTVSGFMKFDDRYRGKPLVFAGTVGLIPRKIKGKLSHEKEARAGDYIVMVGGRVGLDGIHGATFSSVVMDSGSPATAVQIGDPITQKKLSDAIVKEARDFNLYTSITDNGAGGLSCSVAEMAKECGGAKVHIEKVPVKYPGIRPWEVWISESQERMTLSVPKKNWGKFQQLMNSRGVEATVIGEFTNSGKCEVVYKGKKIMDMQMEFLHNGYPKRHLQTEEVARNHAEPKLPINPNRTKEFEKLISNLNLTGNAFVSEQYDHEVQSSSVLKPLSGAGRINTDAQVFKPVLSSNKGVAVSSALYPSYSDIDTYHMAACAIDTAIRNIVSVGGSLKHLAILDNFCWCSSNDKIKLGELVKSLKACYDYAVSYGTPFISGKDSMFNDFSGYDDKGNPIKISIPPTLLISAISVLQDLKKTVSPEFKNADDAIYLLGETYDELGGSEYFKQLGYIGNNIPKVDAKTNLKTYQALENAIQKELVASSVPVNSGGLAMAIAKATVGGMLGAKISVKDLGSLNIDAKLFSESQGRVLVSVSPKNIKGFEKIMGGVSLHKLGTVSKDGKILITDKHKIIDSDVKELYKNYHRFSEKMK